MIEAANIGGFDIYPFMKISWMGFLAKNHSWSVVSQNICRQLIKNGHDVHMFSTNGISHFPEDLKPFLRGYTEEPKDGDYKVYGNMLDSEYDMQLSYTSMINFPDYFRNGSKNRFGIWCYEFAGKNSLPTGFAKNYRYVDKLLPPSNFAKKVFLDSGIPESAMEMIPHGFDSSKYLDNSRPVYDLKTNKKFKILANIAQPHIRKNLEGLLEAYGRAFTSKDDVCLVLKIVDKEPQQPFEVSFKKIYNNFCQKYKNRAEVKIINHFIDDIDTLYRATDALFTMTRSECFFFPGIEAIASNNIVICSNWGGQLDYLSNDNALLIEGKEVQAPPQALYWESKLKTYYFEPFIDDAVEKLRYAYQNADILKNKFSKNSQNIIEEYSWENVTNKIIKLCK